MVTGLGSWGPVWPCRRRALVRLVRCSAAGAKALAALPLNGLTPVQAGNRADLRAAPASPGITCPSGSPGSLPEPPQHRHSRFFFLGVTPMFLVWLLSCFSAAVLSSLPTSGMACLLPPMEGPAALVVGHTFSAFWLRSSVVSVLISLISDKRLLTFEIKLICLWGCRSPLVFGRVLHRGCPAIAPQAGAAHPSGTSFFPYAVLDLFPLTPLRARPTSNQQPPPAAQRCVCICVCVCVCVCVQGQTRKGRESLS